MLRFLSGFCVFSIVVGSVFLWWMMFIVSGLLCLVLCRVLYLLCSCGMLCILLFHGVGGSGSSVVLLFWHSVSSSGSVLFVCFTKD